MIHNKTDLEKLNLFGPDGTLFCNIQQTDKLINTYNLNTYLYENLFIAKDETIYKNNFFAMLMLWAQNSDNN